MKASVLFFSLALCFSVAAQPKVPHKMDFAGMTLVIRDDARKEIQNDVDALTRSAQHFSAKVDLARIYFPVIEQILKEEKVPDDFKYLVLQESGLKGDAVSVSNAVGYWQFKDFTALEMGLKMDRHVDERMNIVSSTRAAARYLKKNNYNFNNWVYALQAYQMGAGGVMNVVKDFQSGTKTMEIDKNTYWYVKKFLAHKIAFEDVVKDRGTVELVPYSNVRQKSIDEVAREFKVDQADLIAYNLWIRDKRIPDGITSPVMIPVKTGEETIYASIMKANAAVPAAGSAPAAVATASASRQLVINGIPAIRAKAGESAADLARESGIRLSAFLKFNDIAITDAIRPGVIYYTSRKRSKGSVPSHVVVAGESLWSISQQYGVRLKTIMKLNDLAVSSAVPPGTVLALQTGPGIQPATVQDEVVLAVSPNQTFSWSVNPEGNPVQYASVNVSPAITEVVEKPETTPEFVTENPVQNTIEEEILHQVEAKQTLYSIARQYGVEVSALMRWNNLSGSESIHPGQTLKIKGIREAAVLEQPAGQSEPILYEVTGKDTLYSIARKYDVSIKELMDWNGKTEFTLSVGEKLRIYK